jgi:hypothetical protein
VEEGGGLVGIEKDGGKRAGFARMFDAVFSCGRILRDIDPIKQLFVGEMFVRDDDGGWCLAKQP